ncbi:MAG TPA: 1-acyl-sn-glycerol-3-phosphate acyltransferase [Kofleriaceae bacterium]|nr:1-acyl-sn-glycerol-3-phosphate acyltransferase [Kofleriaceae bacterium]
MTRPRPVAEAENRLVRFNGERDAILSLVTRRVTDSHLAAAERSPDASIEYVLNDVAYSEIQRHERDSSPSGRRGAGRWRDLAGRLGRMNEVEKRGELERLVAHYARDIVGNFNPRVYRFANDVMPPALSILFTPMSSLRHGLGALDSMSRRIRVEGELDAVRTACDRGTLIVTPTHSSNMDSVVIGLGLKLALLPPVTYGAGKNLFSNPFISYFMHNLGAYRVDRRLRFGLYKDVLKEYSTVLLEQGYHSLFFPGGTRCRSNVIESHLKLGLLGTGVAAYRNSVVAGAGHRRIYVVPATINYRLVLEAETLIEDYLAETGKSRYIIEDDEFSRLGRIVEFVRKILVHEGAVTIRFGRPLDPFGNGVDDAGESVDRHGRRIDPATYLADAAGKLDADHQREAVYTRELGDALSDGFRRETVFMSTHLVSRAVFDAVVERTRQSDIYRLLRLPESAVVVGRDDVCRRVEELRRRIAAAPEWGRVEERVAVMSAPELLDDALRALTTYHTHPVLEPAGERIQIGAMKLCYYYRNRTAHIPDEADAADRSAARW